MLGDSNCWRWSNKYSGQLTPSIYSTILVALTLLARVSKFFKVTIWMLAMSAFQILWGSKNPNCKDPKPGVGNVARMCQLAYELFVCKVERLFLVKCYESWLMTTTWYSISWSILRKLKKTYQTFLCPELKLLKVSEVFNSWLVSPIWISDHSGTQIPRCQACSLWNYCLTTGLKVIGF